MVKLSAHAYVNLPLYLYLIGAYSKFLTVGKCLDSPLLLRLQTQSFCNARCSICPYSIVSKKLDQGTMDWNLFEKIATEAASAPLLSTVVFGLHNEPLLDKRIFDWVKHLKSISPNKYCAVTTNGELLDRFSPTDIMRSNLDSLTISLNAHSREMYESINTGVDYDKVMKNVSHLLSNQPLRQKLKFGYVLTEQNVHEVRQATHYWKSQGVKTRVQGLSNRGGSLDNYERIRLKAAYRGRPLLSQVWGGLMSGTGRVTGCTLPFYQMNVLFNGDAIICCHDWNRASVVGNAGTSSLREIWNSAKVNEIRRLVLRKRYEEIDSCKECSCVG